MNDGHDVHSDKSNSHGNPPLNLPSSLSSALIPNLPSAAYYIPFFITPAEEAALLQHITAAPLPTWKTLSHRRLQAYPSVLSNSNTLLDAPLPLWLAEPIISRLLAIPLHNPGLENPAHASGVGNEVGHAGAYSARNHVFSGGPHSAPNHCLVNEYLPGQGIHPHEDGSAYWPIVCTVSLGSHTVLEISPKKHGADGKYNVPAVDREGRISAGKWRVLQEQRSLLISTGEVYTECLHGIEGVLVDEGLDSEGVVNWDLLGDKGTFEGGRRERQRRLSLTFRDVLKVKALGRAFGALRR